MQAARDVVWADVDDGTTAESRKLTPGTLRRRLCCASVEFPPE